MAGLNYLVLTFFLTSIFFIFFLFSFDQNSRILCGWLSVFCFLFLFFDASYELTSGWISDFLNCFAFTIRLCFVVARLFLFLGFVSRDFCGFSDSVVLFVTLCTPLGKQSAVLL